MRLSVKELYMVSNTQNEVTITGIHFRSMEKEVTGNQFKQVERYNHLEIEENIAQEEALALVKAEGFKPIDDRVMVSYR